MDEKLVAWLKQQIIHEMKLMMDFEREQWEHRQRYMHLAGSSHLWVQLPGTISFRDQECHRCGQQAGSVMKPCPYSEF